MKMALLCSGYLRGLKENIDNIYKNIIQNNDCDIYIHITTDDNTDKYSNSNITNDYIINTLKPKLLIQSSNINFSNDKNTNNILNQNYKFYWLNEEKNKISQLENINYDVVIKIRPDMNINTKINYSLPLNIIYIPLDSKIDIDKLKNTDDKYICDIMAYSHSENMNKYFNYYLHCNDLMLKYGHVNETLLYHYLIHNNISFTCIDIDYFIILSLCNTIAITGDSGSGKTTISNIIKDIFDDSFLLECDRYHKWERNDLNWKSMTHLNPEANYITKMENDVFDLKIGKNIYQVDYNHKTGKFTDHECIESKNNLIVCGLHSMYMNKELINLKIYMDTDNNLRIPWKIKRDIEKRCYTKEAIYEQILKRQQDYNKYILTQKNEADIIINMYTDYVFDISTFDTNDEIDVKVRVGIKMDKYNKYNKYNKYHLWNNCHLLIEDNFVYKKCENILNLDIELKYMLKFFLHNKDCDDNINYK